MRDGINEAAAEYEKMHPNVHIVQDAIPESTYGQWMTTQLIGNTAPDILEAGMVDGSMMNALYTRYLLPVTKLIGQPNPYNVGTSLQGVPLNRTAKDGMNSSFVPTIQEYMTIPLNMITQRVYYNKDLLKKLTGLDAAPTDLRGFLKVCDEIQSEKQPNGQPYVAIAGSRYHYNMWEAGMVLPLSYDALPLIDFNHDGQFGSDEMFMGFLTHKVSFDTPAYKARLQMVRDLTSHFPPGWSGLGRNEGLFNFAQQKAVFVAIGIYEAAGIQEMAQGKFQLGLMDFPLPTKDDPVYGSSFEGRRYEQVSGSTPMAVARSSKHPEVAMDFLLYLVSQKENERFNRHLKWIPVTIGAKTDPSLAVFEPNLFGVFSAFDPAIGPNSSVKWNQLYTLFQLGQISREDMGRQFTDFYLNQGKDDFQELIRGQRRSALGNEQVVIELRQKAIASNSPDDWGKEASVVMQQIGIDTTVLNWNKVFDDLPYLQKQTFYRYTPAALANIRAGLNHQPPPPPRS